MTEEMLEPRIDISQVRNEEIAEGAFPAPYPASDFRVFIAADAHQRILDHSRTNTRVELCGVLVGKVFKDKYGPFAIVENIIQGEYARNRGAQVTFTHETWSHIYAEFDAKFPDAKILGWYHTHPGFGIFLSPMDTFIQHNFFNLPWQVAFVVDPLAETEGLFEWRDGKPAPAAQFWVGQAVHLSKQGRVVTFPKEDAAPSQPIAVPEPARHDERAPVVTPVAAKPVIAAVQAPVEARRARTSAWIIVNSVLLVLILGVLLFRPQVETLMAHVLRLLHLTQP